MVLKTTQSTTRGRIFTVLVITEQNQTENGFQNTHNEKRAENGVQNTNNENEAETEQSDSSFPRPVIANQLFHPEGLCGQKVLEVLADDISSITTKTLKVNAEKIIDDIKKRQMPRFRYERKLHSLNTYIDVR